MPEQLTLAHVPGSMRGRLVVLEGADGVGKSTLAQLLITQLRESRIASELISFPGKELGTLGHHIYEFHQRPESFGVTSVNPVSLQLLHVAAHIDAIENRIRPLLEKGIWIVLDRFWWSTWVYGVIGGIPRRSLKAMIDLERKHWGAITPDAIILVTRRESLRANERSAHWFALESAYRKLASEEAQKVRVHVIDNAVTPQEAIQQTTQVLRDMFEGPASVGVTPSGETGSADGLPIPHTREARPERRPDACLPEIMARLSPAKPTVVYDTYWLFAAERQEVFFRKFWGKPGPWTRDPIIQKHKFTNAYRASDRVSQFLIRNVIHSGDQTPDELFFRTILFKLFNCIETWELLLRECGEICWKDYAFDRYDASLTKALGRGERVYSAAYIMPPVRAFGCSKKHQGHLHLLESMMRDGLPNRISEAPSMRRVFEILRGYPGIGDFLAYQYTIDLNYGPITNFSEMDFVVPGPGAKEGIRKCFQSLGGLNEVEIIRLVTERQGAEFQRLGVSFRSLWGRPLQLIDCQNLFCEVDKYSRLAHPSIKGRMDRTRIKQLYRAKESPIDYWYPPKWQLNIR